MGIFEIEEPIDQWAEWEQTVRATATIQGICLAFSLFIFFTRCYQVAKELKAAPSKQKLLLLESSHLCALLFSCIYIFLHFWNYIHFFISSNGMDCGIWFEFVMVSITLTKNFLYTFLMLRTSFAFDIMMFRIPLRITLTVIGIAIISQWIMTALMISDYIPISPFPDNGFCFRILGEDGDTGLTYWNLMDALSGVVALAVFWWKAKGVNDGIKSLQNSGKLDSETREVNDTFKRHILLGIFIIIGSIVLFFLAEFLSVTMGIVGSLHQAITNFYIFLFFPANTKIYNIVCCRRYCKGNPSEDEKNLSSVQETNNSKHEPSNTSTLPSKTGIESTKTIDIQLSVGNFSAHIH